MSTETIKTMRDFNCEMLEISLRFSPEEMDQDAFLKASGVENKDEYTDVDGDLLTSASFGARDEKTDYHAHMKILFFKASENRIDISFHDSRAEKFEDVRPPYAEDCAQWVGGFFKVDEVKADVRAAYTFDKSYTPIIGLPFPLVTSEKALLGSLITGLSILFPKESPETAVIQSGDNDTTVLINKKSTLNLKEFDLIQELEKLSVSVSSLVRKAGNSN